MAHRLPAPAGTWIARDHERHFEFEGERYHAYEGDTVTSALLAADRRVLGRSFKYHRPRGVLSCANHDANVLLQTATRLNLRGDVEPVTAGERYWAVNTIGGVARDRARWLDWFAPLLPVGFYYKAFHRPRWAFPYWEQLIRRISGLGVVAADFPRTRRPQRRVACDALVIGAGAAGLAAARTLAAQRLAVILVDEQPHPGGSLNFATTDPSEADWCAAVVEECRGAPSLALWTGACAVGCYSDREVAVVTAEGLARVTAQSLVFATGAIEQPAVFRNNDLPGVMLASAALRLARLYGVAACERGVVLGANVDAYHATLALLRAGVRVELVLDLGDPATRGDVAAAVGTHGVRVIGGIRDIEAIPNGQVLGGIRWVADGSAAQAECDGLLMSVGWAPASQLLYQAGARFAHDPALGQLVPATLPAGVAAAGRVNGCYEFAARIADGEAAASEVSQVLGVPSRTATRPARTTVARSAARPWFGHRRRKNFVDFDEDIQLDDLDVAIREGFDHLELLKRFTTNGMGPSQGKHSNLNAARFLAARRGQDLGDVGTTTARPFYHPVELGVLGGRRVRALARSALDGQHQDAGAVWMEAGSWRRPRFYRRGNEPESRAAEYQAVRERVGVIDVSTLGKFEIVGPDAGRLLDLCYTSAVARTQVGATRYVVMCDHRGTIADDGVAARLAHDRFYVTAGSGHALATYRQLTQVAALFGLDCEIIDLTRHLAALNVAGPLARRLLQELTTQDLGDAAFPFLGVRDARVCDLPVRMLRVGFVGECGFEIHLPYSLGPVLWRGLLEAGAGEGLLPFGVETQRLLRLEKGHLIVGHDTDGVTNPFETPLTPLVNLNKPQFLGKAALAYLRERATRALVGFALAPADATAPLEECHLVVDGSEIVGRVTSVGASDSCARTVGLAMVCREYAAIDTPLALRLGDGSTVVARVVPTPFYDPENARQREVAGCA
jgi:sarcosine oxidase subunit alpha